MRTRRALVAVVVLLAAAGAQVPARAEHRGGDATARVAAAGATDTAVARARCAPGSRPETGLQGQVPRADRLSGRAAAGYWCNLRVVGRQGTAGGYNVARYRTCAYYTASTLPGLHLAGARPVEPGVAVVDVRDPTRPVEVGRLRTPAMLSPHESLRLHVGRGLLAAVTSSAVAATPQLDVYDVTGDCRRPQLLATVPLGITGHEGGFSPDGRTYWSSAVAISAIGLDDPTRPQALSVRPAAATMHGPGFSPDGRIMYLPITQRFDGGEPGLEIYDVSDVQLRRPDPQQRLLSVVSWADVSTPQAALPFTSGGRSHLFVVDELGKGDEIGGVTLLDVDDPRRPVVVGKLKLEAQLARNQELVTRDNDSASAPFGPYTAHNCSLSGTVDPHLLMCGMLGSGTRVFDVRDPLHPREVAYFNPGPAPGETVGQLANLTGAWDPPVFVPERRELWFLNSAHGFFVARLAAEALAPRPADVDPAPLARPLASRAARPRPPAVPWMVCPLDGARMVPVPRG